MSIFICININITVTVVQAQYLSSHVYLDVDVAVVNDDGLDIGDIGGIEADEIDWRTDA